MNNNQAMSNCEEDYLTEPEPVKNNDEDDQYNESQEYDPDEENCFEEEEHRDDVWCHSPDMGDE